MPLKIYYDHRNPLFPDHLYHDIYINFEKEKWILTDNISEADIVPVLSYTADINELAPVLTTIKSLVKSSQIVVVLSTFHSDDWMSPSFYRTLGQHYFNVHPRTIIAHTNIFDDGIDPRFFSFNIVFNRQKLYMTNTNLDPTYYKGAWMTYSFPEMFTLSPITEKPFNKNNKHVMCPNRILWGLPPEHFRAGRNFYKSEIRKLLLESTDSAKYYLSDPVNGIILKTNGWDKRQQDPSKVMPPMANPGMWTPVDDYYYQTSYASVFVESNHGAEIFDDRVISPTEKTFDPLIKGHFPIVFSASGTIKCIREYYGFKLPNWIDYSYDDIHDANQRFYKFLESVKDFLNIPLEKLHELYVKDIDILKHNQRVFFDKPYYSLHDRVQNIMEQMGWSTST